MTDRKTAEPREVTIAHRDYQPTKAELEADARIDATFEEAIDMLTKPVKIKHAPSPRRRCKERSDFTEGKR